MKLLSILISTYTLLMFAIIVREIYRPITLHRGCPVCRNSYPNRIRRPPWARSMEFLVSSRAYHCQGCNNRFIHLGSTVQRGSVSAMLL